MTKEIYTSHSKQLIPFYLSNTNYSDIEKLGIFEINKYSLTHLNPNICQKLSSKTSSEIGRSYALKLEARKLFDLPSNNSTIEFITRNNNTFYVKLRNVYLHIFETNVGFLEFEWEILADNMLDYLNANYFLNELKSNENKFYVKTGINEKKELNFIQTTQKIFDLIKNVEYFTNNSNNKLSNTLTLTYTTIMLNSKNENINDYLNKLKNNFKESYLTVESNNYHPFENLYWAGSLRGCVNISYLTGKQGPDTFLKNTIESYANNSYFYLYLLVLNQRFTIQKQIEKLSIIDKNLIKHDENVLDDEINNINELLIESNLFSTRCEFNLPSEIDHINAFYNEIRKNQKIDILTTDFNNKLKSTKDLLDNYKIIKTEKLNRKRNKFTLFAYILTEILGTIAIFKTTYEIIQIFSSLTNATNILLKVIPAIITVIFFISVAIQIWIKIKALLKTNKKSNTKNK